MVTKQTSHPARKSIPSRPTTSLIRGQSESGTSTAASIVIIHLPGAPGFLNRYLMRCLKPCNPWAAKEADKPISPGDVDEPKKRVKTLDLKKVLVPGAMPGLPYDTFQPISDEHLALLDLHPDDPRQEENQSRKPMLDRGLQLIAQGKVAAICLAADLWIHSEESHPIGMLDIGLPSGKSLFQLHAERLKRIQAMANRAQFDSDCSRYGDLNAVRVSRSREGQRTSARSARAKVMWVIVTSPATDQRTRMYFLKEDYFGLVPNQIIFVMQDDLPCISQTGTFLLDENQEIIRAPCGDGGLYTAMARSGALADLEEMGVQYLDVYSAENALARVADPHLVGYADLSGADVLEKENKRRQTYQLSELEPAGAKVVAKAYPGQPGSIFVRKNGQPQLLDSSQLTFRETLHIVPETGRWRYNWADQGSFCFTPTFMRRAHLDLETSRRFYISSGILFTDQGAVMGTKFLARIHDPLPLARKLTLIEVEASAHFAPVRRPLSSMASSRLPDPVLAGQGQIADNSKVACSALLALHRRWVEKFGGIIDAPQDWEGPEISPTKSYLGELLGYAVHGRVFSSPYDPILQGTIIDAEQCKQLIDEAKRGEIWDVQVTKLDEPASAPK